MHILVFGAGAVGLGLSSALLKAGESVTLIARQETVEALKTFGLKRSGMFGNLIIAPQHFSCAKQLRDPPKNQFDFVLLCVKSFDTKKAAEELSAYFSQAGKPPDIVICQNGWGSTDILASYFSQKHIYNARIITGFIRPNPYEVEITVHADSIKLGSLFANDISILQPLAQTLTSGGLPCEITEDVAKDLWAKMLYNCALNPLGAILRVSYGELGEKKETRYLMDEIIKEIFAVMESEGFSTHWDTAEDYLGGFYKRLLPPTATHFSSMLQDIRAGKKTEIDALNGVIVALAQKRHLSVPFNSSVYALIKFIEQQNQRN